MAEVVTMPKLGFDMREGMLVKWLKREGEAVNKGEVIAEIETDKATVEVEAYASGVIKGLFAKEGDVLPIGEPIAVIGAPDEKVDLEALRRVAKGEEAEAPVPAAAAAAPAAPARTDGRALPEAPPAEAPPVEIKASPVARRLAAEHGVDLRQVTGSGPGGRITRRDIEAYLAQQRLAPAPTPAPAPAPVPVPEAVRPPVFGEERPLSRIRQLIARRMVEAKQAPHFYVTIEVDMAGAMKLRQDANALLDDAHKLSVNDLIVKAAALALREFPRLNASFAGDKIIIHPEINIGVAVALEDGLTTVVIRNADQKSLSQIAAESKEIIARTREGKNRPEDFEGITFTTSNLGMYDVDSFIAIINPPNAAILATGAVKEAPVVVDGEVRVGTRMKATISVDHRVSDGAEAARFLQTFKRILEQPLRLAV